MAFRYKDVDSEDERTRLLSSSSKKASTQRSNQTILYITAFFATALLLIYTICAKTTTSTSSPNISQIQKCTNNNLQKNLYFLDDVKPISASEFITRRDRLAQALVKSNVDAFALEPGYTFQYYGNISQVDWEPWEPEERPFLMIVRPDINPSTGEIKAHTSYLSPSFEEGRVRMLGIPADGELEIVPWEEHWNPYDTLRDQTFKGKKGVKIMVDEEMRDYIVRGLTAAGFDTIGLDGEVEAVRQTKSPAEVELLRAVNTGTVEAVRQMRPCLVPGVTENQVIDILNNALLSVGFSLFFNIVLFEENAALPHGGFATGGKILTTDTMVLIDVGAHYQGYSSDICRSFFIDPSPSSSNFFCNTLPYLGLKYGHTCPPPNPTPANSSLHAEKLRVWDLVLDAQTASAKMFKPNNSAASVDIAARNVIEAAGYGYGFTHRVGHGIGIKAHESPYLNKGNTVVLLRPGMTFTSEPGVYIEGRFGVRHEDIYLVKESGEAELLTGRRARGPYEP